MNIMVEYVKVEFAKSILDGKIKNGKYTIREGMILKNNRICLATNSKMKEKVLYSLHNIPLVGHAGIIKTYKMVR